MGYLVKEELLIRYILEGCSISQMEDLLNKNRTKIIRAANRLRDRFTVDFKDDYVLLSPIKELEFQNYNANDKRVMFISDSHIGSIHDRIDVISEAYEGAYKRGIKTAIHLGDLVDGYYKKYPDQIRELYSSDPYDQLDRFVELYPKSDIENLFITGNHDNTLNRWFDINVGEYVSSKRKDFHYLGYSVASLLFGDIKMLLLHGNDDLSIFDDFKLMKVASVVDNGKYDVIARGHSHYYESYYFNKLFCLQVPGITDNNRVFGNGNFENTKGVIYADFNNIEENNVVINAQLFRSLKK